MAAKTAKPLPRAIRSRLSASRACGPCLRRQESAPWPSGRPLLLGPAGDAALLQERKCLLVLCRRTISDPRTGHFCV
jgi:hypothetical protein